jgi:hypothetical protein
MHADNVVTFRPRAAPPEPEFHGPLPPDFDAETLTIALVAAARDSFGGRYGLVRLVLVGELRRIAEAIVALRAAGRTATLSRRVLRAQVQAAAGWLCLHGEMPPDEGEARINEALASLAEPINGALGGRVVTAAVAGPASA